MIPEWSMDEPNIRGQIRKLFAQQSIIIKALLLILRYHIHKIEDGSIAHTSMSDMYDKLSKL